jgi:hypothetical protein
MGNTHCFEKLSDRVSAIGHRRVVLDIVARPIAIERGKVMVAEQRLVGLQDKRLVFLGQLMLSNRLLDRLGVSRMCRDGERAAMAKAAAAKNLRCNIYSSKACVDFR